MRKETAGTMIGNLSKIVVSLNIVLSLSVMAVPQILDSEPALAGDWRIEIVDSPGNVGMYPYLALDSNDHPHISYHDHTNEDLKYARWDGSSWNLEAVDTEGETGQRTSIDIDGNDHPHIAYHDEDDGDLKYAKWTGTNWSIEIVDSNGTTGFDKTIVLDSNEHPHIAYHDYINADLKYAKWTGTNWSIETVDSEGRVGEWSSMALDSNDYPHISYDARHKFSYARWTGSSWNIETVDLNAVWTSIALDSNDFPHVSYFDSLNISLKYAKWTGSGWNIETVDSSGQSVGWWSSIALDSHDCPRIAYYTEVPHLLRYAKWTGSNWTFEIVDDEYEASWWPSLALDNNNNPHIAYLHAGIAWDLRYATKTVVIENMPPVAIAEIDEEGEEGSPTRFNGSGSYDPEGGILAYSWDFDASVDSDGDGNYTNDMDATGATPTHIYSDNATYTITLRVIDDTGQWDIDTCVATVLNVPPTVELRVLPIQANVSLRIAGEKWHDVSVELYEDDILVAEGTLTRYPGSPNDQTLDLTQLLVGISNGYSAFIRYTPEDDPVNGQPNGANPCWIIMRFTDQEEVRLHHTFNVQHPETYVWEVDLTLAILPNSLTFEGVVFDPGADHLLFHWDFGDGTGFHKFHRNNGTFPVHIEETRSHLYPGSGTYIVTLTVEDDDGGSGHDTISIVIP
ncbi:MAG: PKD domain-containing protein [Methanobacteriota archaeon]|nr:MAG: PKD domain-containing protein [Euryarchaeota archaeon]